MRNLRIFPLCVICLTSAFLLGCGGSSGHTSSTTTTTPTTQTIASPGANVASITVNGGPLGNYPDAAFVSVTVCVPGTATCQTVPDILVDTGSTGLRILSSVLTLPLPQQTSGGNPVVECFPFVSGYTWGPVQTADVEIASEKASSVPIQMIGTTTSVPSACSSLGASSDTLDTLGANGIVGVGLFAQDCGLPSAPTCPSAANIYYECPSTTSCTAISATAAQQVQNPVSLFTTDNNGVIIELPAVSGGEQSTATGSLVFGIGTQANNALGSATVYSTNSIGNFTTTYSGTPYSASFIDSGSNGYFFLDNTTTGMAYCDVTSSAPQGDGFYCPTSTENLSATNQGVNGVSNSVGFSIADANTLFTTNDFALGDLGGPNPGAFDWGLPFFFGRNVFTGMPTATYPNGYWAY
jgi:hypothetical protein